MQSRHCEQVQNNIDQDKTSTLFCIVSRPKGAIRFSEDKAQTCLCVQKADRVTRYLKYMVFLLLQSQLSVFWDIHKKKCIYINQKVKVYYIFTKNEIGISTFTKHSLPTQTNNKQTIIIWRHHKHYIQLRTRWVTVLNV